MSLWGTDDCRGVSTWSAADVVGFCTIRAQPYLSIIKHNLLSCFNPLSPKLYDVYQLSITYLRFGSRTCYSVDAQRG